ncbi:hypothetical protein PQQ53_21335 [Paraburkholderia strydomiana]|jgi:hypothetical protein|uniref:hypothetical protein n=1 Tax=Paraburkholderia strydomiana TaxID=1245417 RepID=UPI0038B75370
MKRAAIAGLFAIASFAVHASCMSVASEATTIAEFRDSGSTANQTKAVLAQSNQYAPEDRQWESAITDKVYSSKVKPWNANSVALAVCDPQRGANDGLSDKDRETNYRNSFDRIQNIPGICTGDDCNHVVKIQRWDANTGAMLN